MILLIIKNVWVYVNKNDNIHKREAQEIDGQTNIDKNIVCLHMKYYIKSYQSKKIK